MDKNISANWGALADNSAKAPFIFFKYKNIKIRIFSAKRYCSGDYWWINFINILKLILVLNYFFKISNLYEKLDIFFERIIISLRIILRINIIIKNKNMKCPICQVDLMMTEREGIEIDYCPQCRGVWLDRGELDKIIEKSAEDASYISKQYLASQRNGDKFKGDRYDKHRENEKHYYDDDYHYGKKHKKKGLLRDLFDF